jgi:hypothetical protein
MTDAAKIGFIFGCAILARGILDNLDQIKMEQRSKPRTKKKVPKSEPRPKEAFDEYIKDLVYNERSGLWETAK